MSVEREAQTNQDDFRRLKASDRDLYHRVAEERNGRASWAWTHPALRRTYIDPPQRKQRRV